MVRTKSTTGTPAAVANAVVNKPKKNSFPSLLRKTKGSGIGASRLIPFSQRTHGTVATAVPGQTFPNSKENAETKPPITSLTVNQGSVQVSDLTDPPLHTSEREPPPLDEIRTTVTNNTSTGSHQSATSSLSHSTVVKQGKAMREESVYSPKTLQKYANQATKAAETTVQQVVEATETVVHDGLKLLQDAILEPSCPGAQLPHSIKGDTKMNLSIGSGIVLQAPSPVTLNRVIVQTQEELPPIRKPEMSSVSDAAVNMEVTSLETKPELQRQLSPQTDATVAGDAILSNAGTIYDSRSEVVSDIRKPENIDEGEPNAKANGKKSAFRKVKALFGMSGTGNSNDKKQKVKPDAVIAAGIPVVVGKDVSVGIPKQAETLVSGEIAPNLSASFSDPDDHGRLSMASLTIQTAPIEKTKKASPPSGHRMPSPMGILANAEATIGLEPSPSSVAAVTRQRLPVDEADDEDSTKPKELESPQSPDAMIFETPTSPMENMRPGNSPELAKKNFWGLSSVKHTADTEKVAFLLPAMGVQRSRKTGLEPDDEMVHVRVAVDAPEEEDDISEAAQDEKDDRSESIVEESTAFVDVDDGKIYDDENNVVGAESLNAITEKTQDVEKKMTLADILRTTTIADGFGVEPLKLSNSMTLFNTPPESLHHIRSGYNPFEKRNVGINGNSVQSNQGNAHSAPKTNPFDSSEASGSGENDGIVVIQSTLSSEDDIDVFEKVALMNQAPKQSYINPFDDSSDEEGIPPAPVSSSFKESAAKLSTALLKGTTKSQKMNRKSQGPLSDRFNSKGNKRHSFGDDKKEIQKNAVTKSKSETSSEELYPTEPPNRENTMMERFPLPVPKDSNAVLPTEIEMDEGGTISDLDQSLRHFPMRIVEATEGTIVMSALDLNVNDAQETITTRESFEEVIDRYAVSPSLELFRQKTRSVGFIAPDGRNSPALADSISDIETTIVNTERNDAAVSTRVGLLGLCNPFMLGSLAKKPDDIATEKENEILTLAEAVDENSYEILNQENLQVDMKDDESTQRSAESEIGPDAHPTPKISNEAHHGASFANHHRLVDSASEADNDDTETLSTSKSASNRKKKSLKEPVVYRVAASKSRSFFDDESVNGIEVQPIQEAIEEDQDDPPGEGFSESLTLLNPEAPDICEAESDDFDASIDRYRSVEETPLNPTLHNVIAEEHLNPPIQNATVIDENESHLLNRIISFGKETLGMSPKTKDTIRSRWECMTPKTKGLVERCLQYAEIENAIYAVGTDGGGTIEKVQSSGSYCTGPTPTLKDTIVEPVHQTTGPSRSIGTYTLSFEKEQLSSKSEEQLSSTGTNTLFRTIEGTASYSIRTDLLRTIDGKSSQSMRTDELSFKTAQSMKSRNVYDKMNSNDSKNLLQATERTSIQSMRTDLLKTIEGTSSQSTTTNLLQTIEGTESPSMKTDLLQTIEGTESHSMITDLLRTIEGTESQSISRTEGLSFKTVQSTSNQVEEDVNLKDSNNALRSDEELQRQSMKEDKLSLESSRTTNEQTNSPLELRSSLEDRFTERIRSSSDANDDQMFSSLHFSETIRSSSQDAGKGDILPPQFATLETVRPASTDDHESELILNLGGSTVQRLIVTNSIDGTLRSLEAVWNEPTFTEDDGDSVVTEDDEVDRGAVAEPPELVNNEADDDLRTHSSSEKLLISLSAELSEYLKAVSEDDSRLFSVQETAATHDKTYFASICESFSQPVTLQSLELVRDKLNQELKRDFSTISAVSKNAIAELLDETEKIAAKETEVHDLIDLTGVPSQDEHAEDDAVWLFDVEGGKDNFSAAIFNDLNNICVSPFASFRSDTAKHHGIPVDANDIATQKPVTLVDVEEMFFAMCENGEAMVCGPEPSSVDKPLSRNGNNIPSETFAVEMVATAKPIDVVDVKEELQEISERDEGVTGSSERVIDKTMIQSQHGSFSEYPNMMDQFRSESEVLQSYVTAKSMESNVLAGNGAEGGAEADRYPLYSRASRHELQPTDGTIQGGYVGIAASADVVKSGEEFGKPDDSAVANRSLNHFEVEDILYSFCGGLENAVCGFEGYEVVPTEKNGIEDALTSELHDGTLANLRAGPFDTSVPTDTPVVRKSSGSSVSSSDDFPTLLVKMQRDLRDPTVKEVKNPPMPENHLQSSSNRDNESIRQKQLTPGSDIVNQRRDFLEILFDTTESLLCGGGKSVSVEAAKKVRSKERRKSRKKTSKSEGANEFQPRVEQFAVEDVAMENFELSISNKIVPEKHEGPVPTCTTDSIDALCHNAEVFLGLDSTEPQLLLMSDEVLEKVVVDNAKKALEKEDSFDIDTAKADLLSDISHFNGNSLVPVSTPVLGDRVFGSDTFVTETFATAVSHTENEVLTVSTPILEDNVFDSDSVFADATAAAISHHENELVTDRISSQEYVVSDTGNHDRQATSSGEISDSHEGNIELKSEYRDVDRELAIVSVEDSSGKNQGLSARRLAPVPEVYNPSNRISRYDQHIALSGVALKKIRVGMRLAPKPEFFALDRVSCIAGYVTVPIPPFVDSPYAESHISGFDSLKRNESELLLVTEPARSVSPPITYSEVDSFEPPGITDGTPGDDLNGKDISHDISQIPTSELTAAVEIENDIVTPDVDSSNDFNTSTIDETTMVPENVTQNDLHIDDSVAHVSINQSSNEINEIFRISLNESFDDTYQDDVLISNVSIEENLLIANVNSPTVKLSSFDQMRDSEVTPTNRLSITCDAPETDDVLMRFDKASDHIHGTIGLVLSVSKEDKLLEANELANSVVDEIFDKEVVPLRSPRNLCLQDIFDMAESIISGGVQMSKTESTNIASVLTNPLEKFLEASASIMTRTSEDVGRRPETPIILYDIADPREEETTFPFVSGEMVGATAENVIGLSIDYDHTDPTPPIVDTVVLPVVNCTDVQENDQSASSTQDYSFTGTPVVIGCDVIVESIDKQDIVPPSDIYITKRLDMSCADGDIQGNSLEPLMNALPYVPLSDDKIPSSSPSTAERNDDNLVPSSTLQEYSADIDGQLSTEDCEDNVAPPQNISSPLDVHPGDLFVEEPALTRNLPSSKASPSSSAACDSKVPSPGTSASGQSNHFSKNVGRSVSSSKASPPNSAVCDDNMPSHNSSSSADSNRYSQNTKPTNRDAKSGFEEHESTVERVFDHRKPSSCASLDNQEHIPLEIVVLKSRKIASKAEESGTTDSVFEASLNRSGLRSENDEDVEFLQPLPNTGEVAPFTKTLNGRDDQNVSSLLKRLGITKDTVASSIGPMAQMIELLDDEMSQDDEESLSLLLALTRSETDITSVTESYLVPESPSAEILNVSVRDNSLFNHGFTKAQTKRNSSFRSRMKRSKELLKKSKSLPDDQNTSANSSSGNSEILRSPLLTSLLRRLYKNSDASSNIVSSMESHGITREASNDRKAMFDPTDVSSSLESNVRDIPLAIEITTSKNEIMQDCVCAQMPNESRSFDVCENVLSSDSLLRASGRESPSCIHSQLSSVMDRLDIPNKNSGSSSGFGRLAQATQTDAPLTSSKEESDSELLNLPALLEELEINASKSGSFSIVSTDVEPLDVEDLFHRYDKIVKQMVVLDDDRLARVQAIPIPQQKNTSSDSGTVSEAESHENRQRSRSVGSIGVNQSSSDLTTPSQKARDLRLQLERALQSSAASRTSNAKLGKELTTFQSLIQERRAISPSGRPRFTTQSAPSSPQVSCTSRGQSFYHRNCVSPSCIDRSGIDSVHEDANLKPNSSSLSQVSGKSPIARIRELAGKRQNWDLRSSRTQKHIPAPNANPEPEKSATIVVDDLSPVVSIVDLVSKSSEEFAGSAEPIDLTDPYSDIVDLVTKSSTFGDDGSDTALDYSDDGTWDSLQQNRGQRISSCFYPSDFGTDESNSTKYTPHYK